MARILPGGSAGSDVGRDPGLCVGIDPGLNRTGYAVMSIKAGQLVLHEAGVVRSTDGCSLAERVAEIGQGLDEVLTEFRPGVLAIEQVFSLVRNPKSALLMAHARGAILMTAVNHATKVVHYTPTQIKRLLTGSGRADKDQIGRVVQAELKLDAPPKPHDVADACAVAICHLHSNGDPGRRISA
ncbi:MAG: crossover junction endodeoxyribonuclease RuvC [Planctomycetaceae bacterium]